MLASRTASGRLRPSATSPRVCVTSNEAVLYRDAEQTNQPDERRDVPCLARDEQRKNATDEGDRDRAENHAGLDRRPERDEEQHKHAKQRRADRQRQGTRRPRLALHPTAQVNEVTGGQLQLRSQNAPDIGCRATEIPAADGALDRDATRTGFATDGSRPERLRHVSKLAQRNARAVVTIDQKGANRVERVPTVVAKPQHQVETPLPDPNLRSLLADEPDTDRSNHIARSKPDARCRLAVHRDLQLRQSCELLGTKVRQAVDASDERLGLLGQP